MKYKNYIWDFDGTLYDSYPHVCTCCCQVLAEEGIPFEREDVMRHLLVSFGDMKRHTGMSDEAYRRFVDRSHIVGDGEIEPVAVPFDDCEAVLRAVIEGGGLNFMYTHRNETVYYYLEKYGMKRYFADFVTSEEGFPSKPAPNAVLALMERNGLLPEETIMVGDREIDGLSGQAAGIAGALVNYPPALPDGRSPAEVSRMDVIAADLSDFARQTGIF